jgi:hypothetical protein
VSFVLFFRGGKICLSDHFKPLWGKNVPRYGIAHALALGVEQICLSMHPYVPFALLLKVSTTVDDMFDYDMLSMFTLIACCSLTTPI